MKKINLVNEIFLANVVIALIASFSLGFVPAIAGNPLVNLLVSQGLYIIPTAAYLLLGKQDVKALLRIKKVHPANIVLLVLFAGFISPLLVFLNAISLLFTRNAIADTVTGIVTGYPLIIGITVIALIPAILEESVYRGVFFNEYRKIHPGKGIVLSGLLFGLMHMNFNQFIYAFAMGMIFALLVEATDSILASIIVHFTINGSSVMLTAILPKIQSILSETSGEYSNIVDSAQTTVMTPEVLIPVIAVYGVIAVFSTAIAFGILMGICHIAKRPDVIRNLFKKNETSGSTRILTPVLGLGIVICIGLMLYQQLLYMQ